LIIERGGYLPREEDNWSTKAVFTDGKYKANETWFDKEGKEFHPGIHYYVGGNTKVYGAALLRFRKEDFSEIKHVDGISPSWPISYEDLESYYTEAEKLYHVHGERGIDPTEPPTSEPYPYPPLKHEPRIQKIYDDLRKCGHHPFPLPMGVRHDEYDESAADVVLGHFDGYPDPTEIKADSHVCAVRPSLESPNVTLLTNSYVERLETDSSGREIKKVIVLCDGKRKEYSSDFVVVSCGAINSAALLLRSANDKHPRGLANSSDVVGRHYMYHNNSALVAVSKEENPTKFGKTLGLNDFYLKSNDWDFPLGHMQMLGKSDAEVFKSDAPKLAPHWSLEFLASHALDFWFTTEDLPDPDNRIVLRKDGGLEIHYKDNNVEAHQRLIAKFKGLLNHIGCEEHVFPQNIYLGKKIPLAGTAHQCGTIRFGSDAKSSALDINCKAHDVENLYVVDGSFFVSSTSVNPGLTIMANALRVGDHLLERLNAKKKTLQEESA